MVKVSSQLIKARIGHEFSFGVRAWTDAEIWCVKGVSMLKVVSSEKNSGLKLKKQYKLPTTNTCVICAESGHGNPKLSRASG